MNGQTATQKSFILHKPKDVEPREFSRFDNFLIKAGAKVMTTPKTTSPLEWNKSVLGLVATLITVLTVFAVVLWNYATLSSNFTNYQKTTDDKILRLEQRLDKREEIDRIKELREAEARGYQLKAAEGDHKGAR